MHLVSHQRDWLSEECALNAHLFASQLFNVRGLFWGGLAICGCMASAPEMFAQGKYDVPASEAPGGAAAASNLGVVPLSGSLNDGGNAPAATDPGAAAANSPGNTSDAPVGNSATGSEATAPPPAPTGPPASSRTNADTAPPPTAGGTGRGNPFSNSTTNQLRNSSPPPSAAPTQPRALPLMNDSQPVGGAGTGADGAAPAAYNNVPRSSSPYAGPQDTGMKPASMMRAILTRHPASQLQGQLTSLQDVVGSATNRADQAQRVDAYWDLCSSVADYYLSLRELDELKMQRNLGQDVSPLETEMRTRINTAYRAAYASQLKLANLTGRGLTSLILPSDIPHCASYNTHYQEIFQGGGSAEAHALNDVIGLRFTELKEATAAVKRAEDFLNVQAGNPEATFRALELLALRRRAFVQIARDYNRRIARYSELSTPGQLSAVRLTSMLIYTGVPNTATKEGTVAPPRNRQSNDGTTPRTFVPGSEAPMSPIAKSANGEVEQTSAKESTTAAEGPKQEHSLLVPNGPANGGL